MTTHTTTPTVTPELGAVGAEVDRRIRSLQQGVLANHSAEVAALARLRRAVGTPAGSVADIHRYTLSPVFTGPNPGEKPTPGEIAAHTALTLYATHQQSRGKRMHQRGHGLGAAVRRLHPQEPTDPPAPVLRRFLTLGTSDSYSELVHHLRGLVQLLRGQDIPVDYGQLAEDLLRWQRPGGAAGVRLRWGRDFYRTHTTATTATATEPTETAVDKPTA
ncbi:type I-E CRISPR-associated protein Cse2/CasB [Crossiella sp. CA-258035]|uniref:type I-E CRISPR-associated protein Cse2/CasB n=1 Tax=Crossiella sp. CA-258035 TaxID=2981138 RepID=UPI0024BC3663|nr:type I-E CRISPR-associated protein Cse2/CasB [Crossiella sp. CA-258035]WHT23393.1 type I-E CRISPR-associated protein Cse2/CasB [Crossiella sp. CA-258035]